MRLTSRSWLTPVNTHGDTERPDLHTPRPIKGQSKGVIPLVSVGVTEVNPQPKGVPASALACRFRPVVPRAVVGSGTAAVDGMVLNIHLGAFFSSSLPNDALVYWSERLRLAAHQFFWSLCHLRPGKKMP